MLNGSPTGLYSETVRQFALAVHFFSPRTYDYIREKFSKNLPHVSTIRKWYQHSSANGHPGICSQSLKDLAALVAEQKAKGSELLVALNFDEMAIRKNLQWNDSQKKFLGHTTYGVRMDREDLPLATQAIVYMVHGINFKFSFPIAFHFIQSLNGEEKVALLSEIIGKITECGARVLSVTFDGLISNVTMCNVLGASFDLDDFRPYFSVPGDKRKIYIIFDPSHMIKLARNCVANNSFLMNKDQLRIEWNYFETLEEFRNKRGFIRTHKLNKKHIQYKNFKMNVRLAVETLSNSVANSMQYLQSQGYKEFVESSATIEFIRFVNDVFDVMNTSETSELSGNIFKNPISPANEQTIFSYFDKAFNYFKTLKLPKGKVIVTTRTRTAFKGLMTNMVNFRYMYEECVKTNLMPNFPTQCFSQDQLESFFGRVRSMGGCNRNPTAEQFCSAFRKIIINRDIRSAECNCRDNLSLDILSVSSAPRKRANLEPVPVFEQTSSKKIKKEHVFGDLEKVSIAHIAATIETKIEMQCRFNCELCLAIISRIASRRVAQSSLSSIALNPCQTTFEVCCLAHKHVQKLSKDASYTYDGVLKDIFDEFDLSKAYPGISFEDHEDHKYYYIKYIAEEYIRMHANYIARSVTLNEHTILYGNRLTKVAQFHNQ